MSILMHQDSNPSKHETFNIIVIDIAGYDSVNRIEKAISKIYKGAEFQQEYEFTMSATLRVKLPKVVTADTSEFLKRIDKKGDILHADFILAEGRLSSAYF